MTDVLTVQEGDEVIDGIKGDAHIKFKVSFDKNGKEETTPVLSNVCWGFFYSKERTRDKLKMSVTSLKSVTYLLDGPQLAALKYKDVVTAYLQVLKKAGVAQWFIKAPETVEELSTGCIISTKYPPQMIIGLLEMYRNAHYHPKYIYYVTQLHDKFGLSPGASLIIPRLLRLGINIPVADALCFSHNYGIRPHAHLTNHREYRADLFSERHILKCIDTFGAPPLCVNPDFKGVFRFFASGYKPSLMAARDLPCLDKYLRYEILTKPKRVSRERAHDYQSAVPTLSLSKRDLQEIEKMFNVKYEDTHN